jgi:hypothetical protein
MKGKVTLPNGISTQAVEVRLDHNGEKIILPIENLEILA